MGTLGNISGDEAIKAFAKAGWLQDRQRGSHIILKKAGAIGHLSVPNHKELDRGLLRSLIRDADLTVDEFLALL